MTIWEKCLQQRVDVFLNAFKEVGAPNLPNDDKVQYIAGFETSADVFKARLELQVAFAYLRGAAEALDMTMIELIEEHCQV